MTIRSRPKFARDTDSWSWGSLRTIDSHEVRRVQTFTWQWATVLFIEPHKSLGLVQKKNTHDTWNIPMEVRKDEAKYYWEGASTERVLLIYIIPGHTRPAWVLRIECDYLESNLYIMVIHGVHKHTIRRLIGRTGKVAIDEMSTESDQWYRQGQKREWQEEKRDRVMRKRMKTENYKIEEEILNVTSMWLVRSQIRKNIINQMSDSIEFWPWTRGKDRRSQRRNERREILEDMITKKKRKRNKRKGSIILSIFKKKERSAYLCANTRRVTRSQPKSGNSSSRIITSILSLISPKDHEE